MIKFGLGNDTFVITTRIRGTNFEFPENDGFSRIIGDVLTRHFNHLNGRTNSAFQIERLFSQVCGSFFSIELPMLNPVDG